MTTYKLKTPVEHDGKTFADLSLRAFRFGDAEALFDARNEMHAMRILLCRLADVPNEVIQALDLQDVSDLLAEIGTSLQIPMPTI